MISASIPKEAYKIISSSLTNENSQFTNPPFFNKLVQTLEKLINANEIKAPQNTDILQLINNCKTKDKKYDNEGEKPFFNHWRRVRPSSQNLIKIQRTFGRDVRESCYQNRTTAVWSATPTGTSLSFLNPDQAINAIQDCAIK